MSETYEDIVRKHYMRMRDKFISGLMDKYRNSRMRHEDAENIYQDIFIAIQDNMKLGRVKDNTYWTRYIFKVGYKMASKKYRKIGKNDSIDEVMMVEDEERRSRLAKRIEDILKDVSYDENSFYNDPEARSMLGDELTHTPEPCASIIRLKYYSGLTDAEITEELGSYNSAKAVKAKRWQCMRDLVYRVKMALYNAGIIDEKPVKKSKNGR